MEEDLTRLFYILHIGATPDSVGFSGRTHLKSVPEIKRVKGAPETMAMVYFAVENGLHFGYRPMPKMRLVAE